jgi:hypothetical protein
MGFEGGGVWAWCVCMALVLGFQVYSVLPTGKQHFIVGMWSESRIFTMLR